MKKDKIYTIGEEIMSGITHGLGALAALIGTVVLIYLAAQRQRLDAVLAFAVYGGSLFLLYLMSTLYHSIPNKKAKQVFKIFDHASINLLIAGSYTPFALALAWQNQALGWLLMGLVWSLALLGMALNIWGLKRFQKLSQVLYVVMGWLAIGFLPAMQRVIGWQGIGLLAAGGVLYTIGIIFYKSQKIKFSHGIWPVSYTHLTLPTKRIV